MADKKVVATKYVNNTHELIEAIETMVFSLKPVTPFTEVNVEKTVNLIETTLTDGSKVYDIDFN